MVPLPLSFCLSFLSRLGPVNFTHFLHFLTGNFQRKVFVFLGSIPWFFVSEVFPSNARGKADSIAVAFNWASIVAISVSFLPLYVSFCPFGIRIRCSICLRLEQSWPEHFPRLCRHSGILHHLLVENNARDKRFFGRI